MSATGETTRSRRVLMEGSHAIAEAAIQSGCRFYAGYPITPSTEILEYMSFRQPQAGGVCVNAESEIEAINMVWGAAGCGVRAMIASTGQGISLMQESLAELSNAEIPCVVVNMMRGQSDYYQATRGGGHGDYRHLVLAPHTVQEAVDLIALGEVEPVPVDDRAAAQEIPDRGQVAEREVLIADGPHRGAESRSGGLGPLAQSAERRRGLGPRRRRARAERNRGQEQRPRERRHH